MTKPITVKQVYDAYPGSDLIALPTPITEATTLADLEIHADNDWEVGDTLFMFACRELCEEDMEPEEAQRRLTTAIVDLATVRAVFQPPTTTRGPHLARLMSTHTHGIFNLKPGEGASYSLGDRMLKVRYEHGLYHVGESTSTTECVGNVYGAIERYMQFALSIAELLIVVNDDV